MLHHATWHLLQSFTCESLQLPETRSGTAILTPFGIYVLELSPPWGDLEDLSWEAPREAAAAIEHTPSLLPALKILSVSQCHGSVG